MNTVQIDVHLEDGGALASFGDDVRRGLGTNPKTLPPKYFYDALGSELFEHSCQSTRYGKSKVNDEDSSKLPQL